ncbi:MAG TPA: type II secretion system protein N [Ramlibacter sp.]|nr:type II secretion system protein N [Ramlibacter sp.]
MATPAAIAPPRGSWAWAAAGIALGLLVAIVLFIPASWLASRVESATAGRVLLTDARGSLWNGTANLQLTGGAGSTDMLALPTRVEWHMRPHLAGVRMEVSSACCTPQPIAVRLHPGLRTLDIDVEDSQTHWPAALLAGLGTPWNTLQLDGDLVLSTQGLSVEWAEGRLALAGRAELQAQRMASRLSTLRPMGSYRITVTGGATPTLQLDTLEGALQLNGSGQWVGARLHFNGAATAEPGREEALANLLNIIGRRNGTRSIISIG